MTGIANRIDILRKDRRAIILAHNYQTEDIQDIADYVGDSLGLSRRAAETDARVIVFCGVHFMAETAAILSPDKLVLLPARDAGCPLADMMDVESLQRVRAENPDAGVVSYVNSSAAVKAASDICCTSSNAAAVVASLPTRKVIFGPDRNLAHWVSLQSPKEIIAWPGFCRTHHRVSVDEVRAAREAHPEAMVVVHPECRPEVVAAADHVASTDGILKYVRAASARVFIVGTEMGIIHRLRKENPGKTFYLLSPGLVCPNMKKTTLKLIASALETLSPVVTVEDTIARRARVALERMLRVGG